MNRSRVVGLLFALTIALAACGGGGGSASAPIPNPTNNPGGGNPSPSTSPANSPTPSPTVAPTAVPTTAPVNGNIPANNVVVSAEINFINGNTSWYSSGTASWTDQAGDTRAGGFGQTIGGVPCLTGNMGTGYHVHAFVGLYANGVWEAIPQAIGMENPIEPKASGQPNDTDEVLTADCFYKLHTHDYSGIIHLEDPTEPQNFNVDYTYASLQTLFDEWGEPISATQLATFNGPVAIYVGYSTSKDSQGNDLVTNYTLSAKAPSQILLQHHVAYWLVVGAMPAAGLPQVRFMTEN